MDSPVHNTTKCDHIWTESAMGVVLALRGASAIDEERQSVNIGNSTHRQKGQCEDKWETTLERTDT